MEFCPKCGSMLVIDKESKKTILICRKCGYKRKKYKSIEIKERPKTNPLDDVVFIERNEETLPKTKAICPKCGNNEAFWWLRQMRSADEPPTTFYRCTKCKYSWREY